MTLPADQIREQMIADTLSHMETDGLSGVKARTIAKDAGVSVGTVYNLFGSIDGLIQEANAQILSRFATQALEEISPQDEQLKQQLTKGEIDVNTALEKRLLSFAKVYMDFVGENENLWNAMLTYNQGRSVGVLSQDYDRLQAELFSFLGQSLAGTSADTDAEMRATTSRMLWSSVHGIVVLNYIGQVSETARQYTWRQIEIFVSTFVRGVMV